jgi:hypothetical protein
MKKEKMKLYPNKTAIPTNIRKKKIATIEIIKFD